MINTSFPCKISKQENLDNYVIFCGYKDKIIYLLQLFSMSKKLYLKRNVLRVV